MGISLKKGQALSLTKEVQGLSDIMVGLGWDVAKVTKKGLFGAITSHTPDIDCDASALLLDENGKMIGRNSWVYFGNRTSDCGSVYHTGDNLTGEGDGDDEQILVDLNKVPANVKEILFVVNIYSAYSRKQDFGMIENAFMRIVDRKTNKELANFNLTDNYAGKTAMIFGALYRENGQWEFKSIGEGTTDGSLSEIRSRYL